MSDAIDQCVSCGHAYDRSEHEACPSCENSSLEDYATSNGGGE